MSFSLRLPPFASVRPARTSRQLLFSSLGDSDDRSSRQVVASSLEAPPGEIDTADLYGRNVIVSNTIINPLCSVLISVFLLFNSRVRMNFKFRVDLPRSSILTDPEVQLRNRSRTHCWRIVWSSRVWIICRRAVHALSRRASISPIA